MLIDSYYSVLGLNKNSKVPEIKKAYRIKAKLFHPDLNKSPDAHEKFIEINEAYEYLLNLISGKIYNGSVIKTSFKSTKDRHQMWFDEEMEKAKQRANYYANLKFSDFKKTNLYKTTELLSSISDYMFIALGILAPLGAIIGVISNGVFYIQNGEKKIDYLTLITAFMIMLFGASIIIFFIKVKRRS